MGQRHGRSRPVLEDFADFLQFHMPETQRHSGEDGKMRQEINLRT